MNLQWPPRDRDEMIAWQAQHFTDREIARAVGVEHPTVARLRALYGLEPATRRPNVWTETRCEQLRELWGKDLSAAEIAREMGLRSRNQVIGKAHRLGLPARPTPIKSGGKRAGERRLAAHNETRRAILNLVPTKEENPLGRNDGMRPLAPVAGLITACQWIEGEPGSPVCGKRSRPGKPYCEDHCGRAYLPAKKREAA